MRNLVKLTLFMEYHKDQCLGYYCLYYIVYINAIICYSFSKDGLFVLFADDTIFVSEKNWKGVFNKTRTIFDKVNNYMRCNLLVY